MGTFFRSLFEVGLYKRSQGRVTRQVTFAGLAIAIALGLWRMSTIMVTRGPALQYGAPLVLLLAGLWISYRVVNLPAFADFLIAVGAEMNKVSWPTRTELFRASAIVIIVIFFLTAVLYAFDSIWHVLFVKLGIL